MSKLRLCIAVGFVALAFSAVIVNSAQAGWIVSGSALAGSTSIKASSGSEARLKYSGIEIGCATTALSGGKLSGPARILISSLEFTECKVITPATCTLEGTKIATLPVEGEATLEGTLNVKTKIQPENANKLLATFKLNGTSCASAGKNATTGSFTVLSPEGQDERLWHAVIAEVGTSGELEVGSASATIEDSAALCLENDMTWRFS